ncbi:MAG: UDP-N-acetylmuramoyl-L-alanine--D-glutamate ligase, partial [Candidatus Peribacteraceae bacterium]|nr:UDP-N-acetylmuramoyl-L-alanine--D-glutamate ligase [Candidatus Peribacteraceae bacterium]
MRISELAGKSICILGFGREGRAMLKALQEYAPGCRITIADRNKELERKNYDTQLGEGYLSNLDRFEVIIKSPGIPPNSKLKTQNSKLTTPTQIFFDTIKDSGATVIGVTGSKGKSTTASLIAAILKAAGKDVLLIGNIGEPAIAHLKDAQPGALFVMEMSSYQLMDLTVSPRIAVITAFFPEHLDYHGSLEAYKEAKKHIARFQTKDDRVFFAADSAGAREIVAESPGKRIPFSASDAPVALGETKLLGAHNLSNIAAAFLVSRELGVPKEAAVGAIRNFTPLPHRLQSLGVIGGIEWVDDSISTTPESAIAALDALDDHVATIILGGQDRGYDFTPLAKRLKNSKVQTIILLPDSGATIRKAIEQEGVTAPCHAAATMKEAVT